MQRICAWPKIWTLSGRLSLMRNVQLMKKNKNILSYYFNISHKMKHIPKRNWQVDKKQFANVSWLQNYITVHLWYIYWPSIETLANSVDIWLSFSQVGTVLSKSGFKKFISPVHDLHVQEILFLIFIRYLFQVIRHIRKFTCIFVKFLLGFKNATSE
jgi:hypothetical protein